MLTPFQAVVTALTLTGSACARPAAGSLPLVSTTSMTDTLPYGNRFGFPFTQDEYRWAMRLLFPPDEAEVQVRAIYDPDPEAIGVAVMDGNLLLLAAHSAGVADRVVRYRPSLADKVKVIRADPQRAIDSLRRGPDPESGP